MIPKSYWLVSRSQTVQAESAHQLSKGILKGHFMHPSCNGLTFEEAQEIEIIAEEAQEALWDF